MFKRQHITVIIPAFNEASAIGTVVRELWALQGPDQQPLIDDIVVCDNGSSDNTAATAQAAGARVVWEPVAGYGRACLTALAQVTATDVVVFVDGDHSADANDVPRLLAHLHRGQDLVIGARHRDLREPQALTPQQIWGNQLATFLIRRIWGETVTDLGPLRAIRYEALQHLQMQDLAFGWTIEMQVKAIQQGLSMTEIPVRTLARIGVSKISGTLSGTLGAARGILGTLFKLWVQGRKGFALATRKS